MISKLKQLKKSQGLMRYAKNTSWLFAEKIIRMAASLFIGVWMARYLGPEQFGLLSYTQSFVALFTTIATLGLDNIVVRELVKDETKRDLLLGTAFRLKLLGAIVVLFLLAIVSFLPFNDDKTNFFILILGSATIFQSFNVIDFYFQSKVLSKYVVYTNTLSLFLSSILKISFILSKAPLINFIGIIVFDNFILAIGYIYFYTHKKLSIKKWRFSKGMAKILVKDSWPLILSGIVVSLYMKVDQVMIKEMLNVEAVGQYSAAVRISEAWYFIPTVIASSLFPAIIDAKKQGSTIYFSRLQKLYDLMVWLAIAIALPMTFLSDWVISLLYGDKYSKAGNVLMIHIWSGVFVFLGVAFSKHLNAENLTKKNLYRTAMGAIINLALNYLMIPKYGINGAAITTLVSQICANLIYDIFDKNLRQKSKMKFRCFIPIHWFYRRTSDKT